MSTKFTSLCVITLVWLASAAFAAVDERQAARLGGDELTPLGAERAGNSAGTIPPWTGGLDTSKLNFAPGKFLPDPYPDDKILFSITAENIDQHADKLHRRRRRGNRLGPEDAYQFAR